MKKFRVEIILSAAFLALYLIFSYYALEINLVPVSGDMVVPDLRWIVVGLAMTFLLVAWILAARSGKQ